MRVYIINHDKMKCLLLPQKIEGNYWIVDYDKAGNKKNIINIEASNNSWKLVSNNDYFCYDPRNQKNEYYIYQYLSEHSLFKVRSKDGTINYDLYCSPTKENFDTTLKLDGNSTMEYVIGSGGTCNIRYSELNPVHAVLRVEKNELKIFPFKDSRVFINNEVVNKQKKLLTGDIVFIEGLKIIPKIQESNISIIINNPNQKVSTNIQKIEDEVDDQQLVFEDSTEDVEMNLYNDDDYFHKSPRFIYNLKPFKLQIDPPPEVQESSDGPLLLTIGPMLTMSISSLMTCYVSITNITSGKYSLQQAIPSLITSGIMLLSVLLWPLLRRFYQKRMEKKREQRRRTAYLQYLDKIRKKIQDENINQQMILKNKYPTIEECKKIISNKMLMLWQRNLDEDDFLSVSLGYGNMPMYVDLKFPEEHFSLNDDFLLEELNKFRMEPRLLTNVPIAFSFIQSKTLGIVGKNKETHDYLNKILLQLVTHHSYNDLKLVLLTDDSQLTSWDFMRILPHCWSDDKSTRFFATNTAECNEICYILENIFNQRKNADTGEDKKVVYDKMYLIIIDNFKAARNLDLINNLLKSKSGYGFSLIILNDKIQTLPEQCKIFVNLDGEKAELVRNISNEKPFSFYLGNNSEFDIYDYARKLANIPIDNNSRTELNLPDKVGFLEMYDIGKVESFNCKERWKNSNPILNLQAPVGYGKNGEILSIDLHEKYHGPHGIIAGMTGSGKSEFIITYILSLAVNYHPYEVQFILIDYKGGGIAGAFENSITGIKLPHLIGAITNLDVNEIDRSFASIESELKRRQRLFNKAREISGESTVDIYKYQRMYRDGIVKEPISHLFIISDEFAELKSQQPEFMQQLISIARIGRSLGVHLILATQKPSGVVDAQIWSNTRFRVCLRVQEKEDSKEVIQCPDAALLKQTGRFYFQVGYNEIFKLGQAAWAGGKYFPSETTRKEIDTNINYIDNIGYVIKNIPTKKKNTQLKSEGEELNNIVKYIVKVAEEENIQNTQLWKDRIPDYINIIDIIHKYNHRMNDCEINIPIGEYDAPNEQAQYILTVPFTKEGNMLLYGATGSGKENFISTLIYSSMLYYNASQINYYIIDFGSQSLNIFKESPLVGDIMNIDSTEKIDKLFKLLIDTIEKRKLLFADYNGDYTNYVKQSGHRLPAIVVVINNYEVFQDNFATLDEELVVLTRDCKKYGIYILLACSTPNGVKFKLRQNFNLVYSLQQNNVDDYVSIFGNIGKKAPSKIFGRGIIKKDRVYEFQTAFIAPSDNVNSAVKEICLKQRNYYNVKATYVPVLPSVVNYESIQNEIDVNRELVLGIEKESLQYYKYNLKDEFATIITGNDMDLVAKFVNALVGEMSYLNNTKSFIVNSGGLELTKYPNAVIVDQDYDLFFDKIYNILSENYKKYEKSNFDKNIFSGIQPISCIFLGVTAFRDSLGSLNKSRFSYIIEKAKEMGVLNYVIVDSINNIKKLEMEDWYKTNFANSKAIWIGPGINDQYTIKLATRFRNEISEDFALVIVKGKPIVIKYISDFTKENN